MLLASLLSLITVVVSRGVSFVSYNGDLDMTNSPQRVTWDSDESCQHNCQSVHIAITHGNSYVGQFPYHVLASNLDVSDGNAYLFLPSPAQFSNGPNFLCIYFENVFTFANADTYRSGWDECVVVNIRNAGDFDIAVPSAWDNINPRDGSHMLDWSVIDGDRTGLVSIKLEKVEEQGKYTDYSWGLSNVVMGEGSYDKYIDVDGDRPLSFRVISTIREGLYRIVLHDQDDEAAPEFYSRTFTIFDDSQPDFPNFNIVTTSQVDLTWPIAGFGEKVRLVVMDRNGFERNYQILDNLGEAQLMGVLWNDYFDEATNEFYMVGYDETNARDHEEGRATVLSPAAYKTALTGETTVTGPDAPDAPTPGAGGVKNLNPASFLTTDVYVGVGVTLGVLLLLCCCCRQCKAASARRKEQARLDAAKEEARQRVLAAERAQREREAEEDKCRRPPPPEILTVPMPDMPEAFSRKTYVEGGDDVVLYPSNFADSGVDDDYAKMMAKFGTVEVDRSRCAKCYARDSDESVQIMSNGLCFKCF